MLIEVNDMNWDYVRVCQQVLGLGEKTAPRGQVTYEIQGATIVVSDPANCLPVDTTRGANLAIGAAEALQLIGGVSHPELMVRITRNFAQFRDGGIYHGAYGPRTRMQFAHALRRLKGDRDTRQAVVTIWDPMHDLLQDGMRDVPCTVMFQFFIRNDQLILHTTMRSNDVWWGLAYDVFQFTQLQLTMANLLGIPAGKYFHHVNSLHVYGRNAIEVEELGIQPALDGRLYPKGIPANPHTDGWDSVAVDARHLLEGGVPNPWARDQSMAWYRDQLQAYT